MDEYNKYFSDEFFIIDSDNLNQIEDKLYGFSVGNENIIKGNNVDNITSEGTYVYIKKENEKIRIFQDFNGNYGLYLYKNDDYFAISNSFLKLVEFLKECHELTLNEDFAKYFITSGSYSTTVYKETSVNEIEIIPRRYFIEIDEITKTVSFEEINYEEHSIELNSKKALEILDNWFYKWVNYIRTLKAKTNNIQFDLSGGFDSRIMLLLLLSSNIDLNKVEIRSFDDGELCHTPDFEIANEIAEKFNFKLNNKVIDAEKINFKEIHTPLCISFYTKLGFHNQLNYKFYRTKTPVYNFSGLGGENLRDYENISPKEYIKKYVAFAKRTDNALKESTERILQRTINRISLDFDIDIHSNEISKTIYCETRSCNHFGKLSVEEYFTNKFLLMPFFDTQLHKLKLTTEECGDSNLLFALIYLRYCPELLDFKFEGNRKISAETLEIAKKINELSPFTPKDYPFISGPPIDEKNVDGYYNTNQKLIKWESDGFHMKWNDVDNYLKKIYRSREFKKEFEKYFSEELYYKIYYDINHETYFPLQNSFPAFSILKIINDVKFSKYKNNLINWFDSFNTTNHEVMPIDSKIIHPLLKYITSRIDIKNEGKHDNSIEILENSDSEAHVMNPEWYRNERGIGTQIHCDKGEIYLKIKCVNDGLLNIILKSLNYINKKKERIPIYIMFTEFIVNNEEILSDNVSACHDNPIIFKKEVKNSEILDIYVKWDLI